MAWHRPKVAREYHLPDPTVEEHTVPHTKNTLTPSRSLWICKGTLAVLMLCTGQGCFDTAQRSKDRAVPSRICPEQLAQQEMLATLWMQASGEYRALCYQAFQLAKKILDEDLREHSSVRTRAIITDADETIVSNALYEGYLIKEGLTYPARWSDWLEAAKTSPLPGALEFLRYAESKGVRVFYVSNRTKGRPYEATLRNLKNMGFPYADAEHIVLNREGESSDKSARHARIEAEYDVVLWLGDNLDDFPADFYKKSPEERIASTDEVRSEFGTSYIVLPNPSYGSWLRAIQRYDNAAEAHVKDEMRRQALQSWK